MINKLITSKMQESDINQAVSIWVEQYKRYCANDESFPSYWVNNTIEIEGFLRSKVKDETAIVAMADNKIVGYMTYDEFPFNGEKSVFCPAIAHAAVDEYKEEVYLTLYKSISKDWTDRNIFNHMWTINYNDTQLRSILYDLGFGSYVIDSFASVNTALHNSYKHTIKRAELLDADILFDLVEESREYYRSAPLFLRRDPYSKEEISEVIQNGNVFIAFDRDIAIGFINVNISQGNNIIDLSVCNSGLIDEIGAYIKPEYRGKGLGKELLSTVFDYCYEKDIKFIHVDFETANLYANKFWRKYFNPMLLSVRRTINKNIYD